MNTKEMIHTTAERLGAAWHAIWMIVKENLLGEAHVLTVGDLDGKGEEVSVGTPTKNLDFK